MPRNLDRRVEILFPVQDPRLRQALLRDILATHLKDNVQAHRLLSDGRYERIVSQPGEPTVDSQMHLLESRGVWNDGAQEGGIPIHGLLDAVPLPERGRKAKKRAREERAS